MTRLTLLVLSLLLAYSPLGHTQQPLPTEQAFIFTSQLTSAQQLQLHWQIAPGYYLYRDRFAITSLEPETKLGKPILPAGINKEDDILGRYQAYEQQVTISVPITAAKPGVKQFTVHYQGCAKAGFCYPPVTKTINITLAKPIVTEARSTLSADLSNSASATQLFDQRSLAVILLGFFGFGLLLALTPCVWPMVPILSSIILGQGSQLTTGKAFRLSLTYVISMAVTYAGAGVLAALAGSYLQASLQNPWVIGTFSVIFIVLALALFDCYVLQLPAGLQNGLNSLQSKQRGGTYLSVAIMGGLSVLIVSPCVSAPLVGALAYIGKTGNQWLGGSALFALGLGMGLPLLILGTMGGKWLPKAGAWMLPIKSFFGFLLLAVAISLLQRIIPAPMTLILWAALALGGSIYLKTFTTTGSSIWAKAAKGLGILLFVYAILLLAGALQGSNNPLQPIPMQSACRNSSQHNTPLHFQAVNTIDDVQHALTQAQENKQRVMLDFYADWCVACKQMDRTTFTDTKVQQALKDFLLLRADLSKNSLAAKALQQKFNVIAPPTMLFFSANGVEIAASRIVGEVDAQTFLERLP